MPARTAPQPVVNSAAGVFTDKQREVLLRPVRPGRVLQAQGQSHLPAFDVEAHLTRMFGFEGWDKEVIKLWLISEDSTVTTKPGSGEERTGWFVTYGCHMRITIRDIHGRTAKVLDGTATGSAQNLPSRGDAHDFALKNADSYALKRACKALGDQFGLSLYNKGNMDALVKAVVAYEGDEPEAYPIPQTLGHEEGGPMVAQSAPTSAPVQAAAATSPTPEVPAASVAASPPEPFDGDDDDPLAPEDPAAAAVAPSDVIAWIKGRISALSAADRKQLAATWKASYIPKLDELPNSYVDRVEILLKAYEARAAKGTPEPSEDEF